RADAIAIADADLVIRQALDGEVLAELAVDEIAPAEPVLPVPIRLDLVDENGSLLAAVPAEIRLLIALDVEPLDPATALYRVLPDGGTHNSSAPLDLARQSDVK